ncbi:MAG: CHAT domain-containing protein [Chloroflexi bacterium]|nr:CHAT domain-containing protein [Chloroflexota bacterium]
MPGTIPDVVSVSITTQADSDQFRIQLEMPDRSQHQGKLDLGILRGQLQRLDDLYPIWHTGEPEAYGQILFESLFPGTLSYHLGAALSAAKTRGIQLRLDLEIQTPQLHTVPWERLYVPSGSRWIPLAAAPDIYFSRYLSTGQPWGLPQTAGPLRVLIVISAPYPPESDLFVDKDLEVQTIIQALEQYKEEVQFEVLEGPATLDNIIRALDRDVGFDILHYTGHGVWNADEGVSYLILEKQAPDGIDPAGTSADKLLKRLELLRQLPRLIVLSACESAQQRTGEALVGLGPRLVAAGCPAVVCMQASIQQDKAGEFDQHFYAQLIEHGFIDQALNRARAGLYDETSWQWAIPVLFMRMQEGLLFLPRQRFRQTQRVPYKFLGSYTREDADLFRGRSKLSTRVYERILEQPLTVLHGAAGVGLTSLVEAGVRPKLEEEGALVIVVSEYEDIASEVRVQVRVDGHPVQLRIPGDASLADVLQTLAARPFNQFVLVLDQFERAFELSTEAHEAMVQALVESLPVLGARLRILFVVHSDYLSEFAGIQDRFTGMEMPWIQIPLLDTDTATLAIIGPLDQLGWPVTVEPEFAHKQIAGDLDKIYESENAVESERGSIDPGQLQIVCYWLYDEARQRPHPTINEALYVREMGGAEGILVIHMKKTLAEHLADERELAEKILVAMAAPDADIIVTAEDFVSDRVSSTRVQLLLDRLVQTELLERRRRNGGVGYAFASQTVAQEARNLGGDDLQQRYRAGDELERIWRMWLATLVDPESEGGASDQALPQPSQLRYLAESGVHLRPTPQKALLLLRGAVAHYEQSMHPWIDWLRTAKSRGILLALEQGLDTEETFATLDKVGRLLGIAEDPTPKGSSAASFGAVAYAAVNHSNSVTRQTAALALTILEPSPATGIRRIENALEARRKSQRIWRRQSELWGTLLDAEIDIKSDLDALSWPNRTGIWLWRVWRRFMFERQRILLLAAGGALGAGLGLSLLRGITAPANGQTPGLQFSNGIFWGFLLGVALTLGLLLPEILLLERRETPTTLPEQGQRSTTRSGLMAIILGTAGFTLMHLLIMAATGYHLLAGVLFVGLAGLLTGLGVSLALWDRPWGENRGGALSWPLRFSAVLITAVLGQLILLTRDPGWSSAVGIPGTMYRFRLAAVNLSWWQQFIRDYPDWFKFAGVLDALLVGIALFLGIVLGVRVASRWYSRLA